MQERPREGGVARGGHVLSSWLPWLPWLHFLNTTQTLPAFLPAGLSPPSFTFFSFLIQCKHCHICLEPTWQLTACVRVSFQPAQLTNVELGKRPVRHRKTRCSGQHSTVTKDEKVTPVFAPRTVRTDGLRGALKEVIHIQME